MTSHDDAVVVRAVDPNGDDFTRLSSAMSAEVAARYPELDADDFAPPSELHVALVAYCGETPVGCGALRELEPGVGEIKRMFVVPEARGLGIARRLLEALEEQGHSRGYSAVRLGTGIRQPEALALYESSGYRCIPPFGEYAGGTLCSCHEKSLR